MTESKPMTLDERATDYILVDGDCTEYNAFKAGWKEREK